MPAAVDFLNPPSPLYSWIDFSWHIGSFDERDVGSMKEEEEAGAGVVFAWIAWNAVRVSRVVKRSLVMVVNPTVRFNATVRSEDRTQTRKSSEQRVSNIIVVVILFFACCIN